ncbi:hypothetical protein DN429_08795 [Lactobacillus reuteri]|nr:hypothetical protein [Limosilactobacillus reuteri]
MENDIGLALMALNLTKFGQSISRLATNFINNLKSGLRFLNRSKIVVRILLLENQELIVNSQPPGFYFGLGVFSQPPFSILVLNYLSIIGDSSPTSTSGG